MLFTVLSPQEAAKESADKMAAQVQELCKDNAKGDNGVLVKRTLAIGGGSAEL